MTGRDVKLMDFHKLMARSYAYHSAPLWRRWKQRRAFKRAYRAWKERY